jgi:hypothetical protein
MSLAVRRIEIWTHRLTPALGEIRVTADAGVDVRGRLIGPRCRFASTVEVAYPLRPATGSDGSFRALVPEPSMWEPECPFLYHGIFELWLDGRPIERETFSYGLRGLGRRSQSVFVNGRAFAFRLGGRAPQTEREAMELRARGVNVVVAGVREEAAWDLADSFGFFVLGEVDSEDTEQIDLVVRNRCRRASLLAWLVSEDLLKLPNRWEGVVASLRPTGLAKPPWIALSVADDSPKPIPDEVVLLVRTTPEPAVVRVR